MSLLSNLLGQESENVVYDPNELPQYQMFKGNLSLIYGGSRRTADGADFYNVFNPALTNNIYGYTVECTVADTYVTLADITNPKGGYLYFIITPSSTSPNGPVTVKITIDGVVYEMVYDNTAIAIDMAYVIGDFAPSRIYNSAQSVWKADYTGESSSMNRTTLSFLPNNRVANYTNISSSPSINSIAYTETYSPKVKFFNTLKVEVKTAWINSDIDDNKACAYIKTF